MKRLTILLIGIFCIPGIFMAQDSTMSDYTMVKTIYMKCKVGMNQDFQEAVHKHNDKYHPEGPYDASLWSIATGEEAGWYVWVMGSVTFTELDGAPGKGDHADHWTDNVSEYVQEYGRVEYWKLNTEYTVANEEPDKMFESWNIGIEEGMYHDFEAFMDKVHVIHAKHPEDEIKVWSNVFWQNNGRDIAIDWAMESWADRDKDDWKFGMEYEEEYGPGSWSLALDDWREFTTGMSREVWMRVMPEKK